MYTEKVYQKVKCQETRKERTRMSDKCLMDCVANPGSAYLNTKVKMRRLKRKKDSYHGFYSPGISLVIMSVIIKDLHTSYYERSGWILHEYEDPPSPPYKLQEVSQITIEEI